MTAQRNRLSPENREEIAQRLSREDPARWLASRFCTPDDRARYVALMALNLELAKVASIVSEPIIGQIRFQWWREGMAPLYAGGEVRAHDTLSTLLDANLPSAVALHTLIALIDSHERRFLSEPEAAPEAGLHFALGLALGASPEQAEICRAAGNLLDGARARPPVAGRIPDKTAMADLARKANGLPARIWPALLPVVFAPDIAAGKRPGDLALRGRLFWAMLTGRL
jgi:15-cis-phytoene synthase